MNSTRGAAKGRGESWRLARLAALFLLIAGVLCPAAAAGSDGPADPYAVQETVREAAPDCRTAPPPYPGMTCVHDGAGRYTLWTLGDWPTVALTQAEDGAFMLMPDLSDWSAKFSIKVTERKAAIAAADVPALTASFDTLIRALPGTRIEWQARWWKGGAFGLEAHVTAREGDQETTRWVRMLYAGTRQYSLVAEAPEYEFQANYPSFLAMMMTFWPE